MQHGQIFKSHGAWFIRYYADELVDGQPVRRRITKKLAKISNEHRTKSDLDDLVMAELARVNRGDAAEGSLSVSEFAEKFFLPWITANKKPSTTKFYRELLANHVTPRVGDVHLRAFSTLHAQRVLDAASSLSHQSCLRIKTGMSALMSYALRLGYVTGANPAREAKAEGTRSTFVGHAYTLKEIEHILSRLDEPARTVCAVAAFSGLREGEIRGLRWEDYNGELLRIRRSVWRAQVSETKTETSTGAVPVIEPLQKLLAVHKRRNGAGPYIFAGEKMHRPLNLANLARRDIIPAIGADAWRGWHAFRRGLATNLYNLGVKPEVAQTILRHADAATTRRHYIVLKSEQEGERAMRKLGRKVASWAANGQQRKRRKSRAPA